MPKPEDMPLIDLIWSSLVPPLDKDEVPIFGDVWRAQQAVIDFYEYGCFPEYIVWVRTLGPALGEFVLGILGFGLGDILRGYFRPTGIRGIGRMNRVPARKRGRGADGRAKGLPRFGIPEIGNEVGKQLPGAGYFRGRKVTNAEMYLWTIDGVLQRGLFYWLMADLTADFIVNWTTAIMESEECQKTPAFQARGSQGGEQPYFMDTWNSFVNAQIDESEPSSVLEPSFTVNVPAGETATILVEADFRPRLGNFSHGEIGLRTTTLPNQTIVSSGAFLEPGEDAHHIILLAHGIFGSVNVRHRGHGTGSQYFETNCRIWVMPDGDTAG